uniref:DNA/RNA non-specific endonuclease n=1 Tax=Caulobacter sp. (strain K31) TaxID=366602 RepID=B0T4I5_CAUSK
MTLHARPSPAGTGVAQRFAAPLPKESVSRAAAPMVQMWKAPSKVPWMANGKWDAFMKGGKTAYMVAQDLKLAAGKVVGAGNNAPTVAPQSWNRLKGWKLTHTKGPPGYVRMHMLSDRMGGAGNTTTNLAPGTNGMNQRHFHRMEKPLINALDAGGEINSYKVYARYQIGNGGLVTAKGKTAWQDTLSHIRCRAVYRPKAGAAKVNLNRNINETAKISGKKNWKGH